MKPAYAKYFVSAHLHLVPVIRPSHPHLVHRANLHSPALAAHFQAVVPQALASQAPALLRALHLVLHPALRVQALVPVVHFQALAALSHLRARASHPLVRALHLVIQLLAQAVRAHLSQALVLRVAAAHFQVAAAHLSAAHRALAIQLSQALALLAAHLAALHLHLRVRASRYCKASISIRKVMKVDILLRLWDLERLSLVEWIMA